MAASAAVALAIEWLMKVQEIRSKSSNMQGKLSGHLKRNVQKLKEIVRFLVGKAEAVGDTLYLRMRNSELSQQLTEVKTMCEKNKKELKEANKRIKELQARDRLMESRERKEQRESR